jgi:hypothetical protein
MTRLVLLVFLPLTGQTAFVPEEGSFSVVFPATPIHDVLAVPTPEGSQTRHVFRYDDGDANYWVWHACTPPPSLPSDPNEALNLARSEVRKTIGGKSLSDRPIKVSGHPGREFVDELEGHKYFGRTVLGPHGAFYSIGGGAKSKAGEARVRTFLRSFRLLPPSSKALCHPR